MLAGETQTVRFGRYDVLRAIGEGGMARVFLCVRRGAGRFEKLLVLKVLHPKVAGDPEALRMFLEEARVLSRLHHPNVVDVYEVDQVDGVPYMAIEYVHGPTLGRLYRHVGRPTAGTLGVFVELLRQVCDGLHHAHTLVVDGRPAGVVHRDVSSQNIVIDARSGLAKLIDFGIAKAEDADRETQLGILKGRLHYIAPEVLAGSRPDARADLYAVGVVLHRILYGHMPYADGDLTARRRPPALPSEADVPPLLRDLVAAALSPDPDRRPQTAADLSAGLRAVCDGLGMHQARIPPFLARVFPRGEDDWQQPESASTPRSIEAGAPVPPPGPGRWSVWHGVLLGFAVLGLLAAAGFAGLIAAALVSGAGVP